MAETANSTGSAATVSLREITRATVWSICDLKTTPAQERFCGPNVDSLIETLFAKDVWFRAIYAGETPVGFVMVAYHSDARGPVDPATGEHFLWRLMLDRDRQRKGYGQRTVKQVIEHLRSLPGATYLVTSCGVGNGSPRDFYRKLGFEETGEIVDDEVVLRLPLIAAVT